MNSITKQQDSPEILKLLAAQRELYSSAKKTFLLQTIFSVAIPVLAAFSILYYPDLSVYGAIYGILFLVIDEVIFNHIIDGRKRKAVSIQEKLDCSLFGISPSPLRPSNLVTDEEIQSYYTKHIGKNPDHKLKAWYPEAIADLNNDLVATLICQRANCWWDSKLKRRYKNVLTGLMISVPALVIILGVINKLELTQGVHIINTLVPFFAMLLKERAAHSEADQRLKNLHSYCQDVFNRIKGQTLDLTTLPGITRRIQDAIYENRLQGPLVFDIIYDRFRSIDEEQMKRNAAEQVEAIKDIVNKPEV